MICRDAQSGGSVDLECLCIFYCVIECILGDCFSWFPFQVCYMTCGCCIFLFFFICLLCILKIFMLIVFSLQSLTLATSVIHCGLSEHISLSLHFSPLTDLSIVTVNTQSGT